MDGTRIPKKSMTFKVYSKRDVLRHRKLKPTPRNEVEGSGKYIISSIFCFLLKSMAFLLSHIQLYIIYLIMISIDICYELCENTQLRDILLLRFLPSQELGTTSLFRYFTSFKIDFGIYLWFSPSFLPL